MQWLYTLIDAKKIKFYETFLYTRSHTLSNETLLHNNCIFILTFHCRWSDVDSLHACWVSPLKPFEYYEDERPSKHRNAGARLSPTDLIRKKRANDDDPNDDVK